MSKIKVVHYINQFFAQIGGEEKADYPAEIRIGEVVGHRTLKMKQRSSQPLFVEILTSMKIWKRQKPIFWKW